MNKQTLIAVSAATFLAAGAAHAAQQVPESGAPSIPISTTEMITPYIVPSADGDERGGNRTCADVGKAYFGDINYYECFAPKQDYPFSSSPAIFEADPSLPATCANTITVTTDGTFVDWSSTKPVGAAIIKGGPNANTYVYVPQVNLDTRLASPPTPAARNRPPNTNPAGLSNIGGFCWNPTDTQKCFDDETAWAAGTRYTARGNWATYTAYAGMEKTVTLFAGQTINVGTVKFTPLLNGFVRITVTLTAPWAFEVNFEQDADGNATTVRDNNVKVQDYATAPSGNPAPGLFMWKGVGTGTSFSIQVPNNNFYGVHVDVAKEKPCPVE
jgi:hypothetical protein